MAFMRARRVAISGAAIAALGVAAADARRPEPTYPKAEIDRKLEQLRGEIAEHDLHRQETERRLAELQTMLREQEVRLNRQAEAISAKAAAPSTSSAPGWIALAIALVSAGMSSWPYFTRSRTAPRAEKADVTRSYVDASMEHTQKIADAIERLEHPPLNYWETKFIVETGDWLDDFAFAVSRNELDEGVIGDSGLEGYAVAFWQALTAAAIPELEVHRESWKASLGKFAMERSAKYEWTGRHELPRPTGVHLGIGGQTYL